MKIALFSKGNNRRIGIVVANGIIQIDRYFDDAPSDMKELIKHWDIWGARLEQISDKAPDHPMDGVVLHAPVSRPGKIMGFGLNYVDHAAEAKMDFSAEQLWFMKAATAVSDPFGEIDLPKVSEMLDYEVELVAVIGKGGRHVREEDAADAIFGYCVGNDVSVRDWQVKSSQFNIGKSFDTHAPFGPWIVTADEIDPHKQRISCSINGEMRQDSNTRYMKTTCFEMVAFLSKAMTLEPGDLLFTGTPGGVAGGMDPPAWLKAGDVVRSEIAGIGAIENVVRAEP
jgi:2-keto-4-pentenoate hydratase/2-oxohepta-3-ene-1,7-dioic acid hydratase in catechol pathway